MVTSASGSLRVRKSVNFAPGWDSTLTWYAKAVQAMKALPLTDPVSWSYQAAMHGYDLSYPEWASAGVPPPVSQQKKFWKQCQHGSWYFLPWHRMYLACFEEIVAAKIVQLGGPADWALPYWDYSASNGNARKLPPAFAASSSPFSAQNPLFDATRILGTPQEPEIFPGDVALSALNDTSFTPNGQGGSSGFGGPVTAFSHSGQRHGALESLPHDVIHMDVGGLMQDPTTAGLDPIFWLHHANIDRLWEVWRNRSSANTNPTQGTWQNKKFVLHRADRSVINMTPKGVLSTQAVLGGYRYDGLTPSIAAQPLGLKGAIRSMIKTPSKPPQMLAASAAPLDLKSERLRVALALPQASAPMASKALGGRRSKARAQPSEQQTFLNFEGVKGKGKVPPFDVYLNLKDNASGEAHRQHHAGSLPMFGIQAASLPNEHHAGNGIHYMLDITALSNQLKASGLWDPAKLDIVLMPRRKLEDGAKARVDRISLYVK
jgi:tyrosinase